MMRAEARFGPQDASRRQRLARTASETISRLRKSLPRTGVLIQMDRDFFGRAGGRARVAFLSGYRSRYNGKPPEIPLKTF